MPVGNYELLEQEIIHKYINGMDFGNARMRVLCRKPDRLLVHIPPHTSYAGRMLGSVSGKGSLWRFMRQEHGAHGGIEIAEGGRFDAKRFKELADPIDKAMGEEGLYTLLEVGKTLVLGDSEPFSRYGSEIKRPPMSKRDQEIIERARASQQAMVDALRAMHEGKDG